MAIVSKIRRDGVDVVIESLQQRWYAQMIGFWEAGATYQMYPRANKNYKEDQLLPDVSLDNKDYTEVLMSDKFSVTSFFLNNDERIFTEETKQINQSISIIFQADLVALYDDAERMDEVFNNHMLRVIRKENPYIFGDIVITEGVDNVYRDLIITGDMKKSINVTDMSHMHVVKFTFDVIYKPNCNVNITPICAPVSVRLNNSQIESVPSGQTLNITLVDQDGNTPTYTYDAPTDTLEVNTGGGGSTTAQVTNSDGSFTDLFDTADNPYEIPDSPVSFNGSLVDPLPATLTKNIELYNNASNMVGSVVQDDPTSLLLLAPDGVTNVRDSANNLLFVSSVASGETDNPQVGDVTQTLNGSPIANNKAQTSKSITIRHADDTPVTVTTVTDTETVFIGAIPNVVIQQNSATVFKSGAVTSVIAEDDGATKFGRGVDWYTLGYNNYFGTTRRFTGRTGGYQSGGSYFDVNGNSTTESLAFPDTIRIDWAYWDKATGNVHWWDFTLFSSTGTNALANQPYTLHGFSDWILPNIPMHRTLYNYEFFQTSTLMNYNPFNLAGLTTANRLWLSNVPSVTTNLMNFSGADTLTNNSLVTTCKVMAFRLGNISEL